MLYPQRYILKALFLSLLVSISLVGCGSNNVTKELAKPTPAIRLIEHQDAISGTPSITYSKYELANGLTVILAPDHSDPLVHVDVTYHVGSAREEVGKSGFAHFFEHMMFQGSKHVGDQQHFKIITEAGGELNGTTNKDRTNYYQTVPANQLEKVLWLEADRMGFLLEAVSQRKFEIQRDTVKNERALNYDNRPYGLIWERMGEAIYPQNHPYSWQTIGYVDDLDRVDVNDLKAFFLRWYGPNNAVLTIGGDIDIDQTLAWVEQYFGSIPTGPQVLPAPKQPATLNDDKYITLEDRIQQPMLVIGWPTSYRGAQDQRAIDALASAIGHGRNSLLYKKLVKTQKALSVSAFHQCSELACNFYIIVMTNSGEKAGLMPIYQEVMDLVDNLSLESITQENLDEINGTAKAGAIFALQSVRGKVSMLASNETFYGQPDRLQQSLDNIQNVTIQSVYEAFKHYIHHQPKVTLSVIPRTQLKLAVRPANFVTPTRHFSHYQKIPEQDLALRPTINERLDRSVMPTVSDAVSVDLPKLYQFHTSNDIEVMGSVSNETPTVLFQLKIPAGRRYAEKGKEGVADLTAAMINEGTKERNSAQIQSYLNQLGSSIQITAGEYTTSITVSSLTEHFDQTLNVMEEMLFHPAFNEQDFSRIHKQALEGVVYEHQIPSWLASQATRQVVFGDSTYGRASSGTIASISSLTMEDIKAFYQKYYTPKGSQMLLVGDISAKDAKIITQRFVSWQGEDAPILRRQDVAPLKEQKLYLVDKPNAPQSIVRLVRRGMPFDATGELYLSQLANFNLGGNFNSRINQNLREDKGYTYGAGSYFAANREVGVVVFNAQVRADATLDSIQELLGELKRYSQAGMSESELNFMRLAVGQKDALKYETPAQKAQLLSTMLVYSLDHDYLKMRAQIAESVSLSELNQVAQKWFDPTQYQIIVVGDAQRLQQSLRKLNIPIQQLEITP